jgi:hypothetical protein
MNEHDKNTVEGEMTFALTRREWLLRLGEAAVLAGFSGAAGERLEAFDPQTTAKKAQATLPPGLYEPSTAHMAHALTMDQRFITPPPGSETEYITPNQGAFEPAFFLPDDFQVVRQLVRVMLNKGEGPAPAGIAVVTDYTVDEIAQWIDLTIHEAAAVRAAAQALSTQDRVLAAHFHGEEAVRRLESEDEQKIWSEGLAWLKEEAAKFSPQGYLSLTEAQQAQLLGSVAESATSERTDSAGTRFYRTLKRRTAEGYYTSQAGLKELDYQGNAFHAEPPGCPQK